MAGLEWRLVELEWRMGGWIESWLHWRGWREQERSGFWGGGECGRGELRGVEPGARWKEGACEWGGLTSVTSDPWGGGECGWT